MKYSARYSPALMAVTLLFSVTLSAQQPWSGILPSSRAINWSSAGLPSTIAYGSGGGACNGSSANCVENIAGVYLPPARVQCGSTISAGAAESTIQSAMNACKPGTYVLLGPGSFSFASALTWVSGVTLRGSGGSATTINLSGSGTYLDMGTSGGLTTAALTNTSSNYAVGTTSFIIATSNPPSVGQIAWINQCNTGMSGNPCTGTQTDNSGLWICVLASACNQNGGTPNSGSNASEEQNFIVASATNNGNGTYTVGTSTGLYAPNWSYAQTPRMTWQSGVQQGMALEDLTVSITFSTNEEVQIYDCYACWVKGVRVVGVPVNRMIHLAGYTKNSLVMNSDMENFDPNPSNYLSSGSSTCIQYGQDSDSLIINNIHHGCIFENFGATQGDVLAYNYLRDSQTSYYQNSEFFHDDSFSGTMFNLREGNEVGVTYDDDTWGTKDVNTWFRNYVECWDPPYNITTAGNGNPRCITMDNYSRVDNAVGNVQGSSRITSYTVPNSQTSYAYVWGFGSGADPYNALTALRWGNVSTVTQSSDTPANSGVRFVSSEVPSSLTGAFLSFSSKVPSSDSLPCSFFLPGYTSTTCTPHPSGGAGLPFWKVCKAWTAFPTNCSSSQTQPFPPIGPDVSGGPYVKGYAYDIPAMIAWQNLPIDSTYQHHYTVTASSWSNGIETLTVSGLPSSSLHVMGGFQLSGGAASSCTPAGALNSEILMTGSSTTTISYATTNPGTTCTGTLLFPDIRQFDERVYQNDSGTQPSPATSLIGPVVKN